MAKFAATAVLDGLLDVIATATEMYPCVGQPTDRATAITASRSAAIVLTSGDFSKTANGTGRRLTVAAKSVTASASGTIDHVAYCSGSVLLAVTTLAAGVSVAGGGTINIAAVNHDSPQPV